MMTDPLVSVVVPTHNRERLVVGAVESVLAQSYPNIEVIVVDDGSTDGTRDALSQFGDQITVVSQSATGPGAARNTGIRRSTGDFVAFLDSDDLWLRRKLESQMQLFADPEVGMVGCGERWIDLSGKVLFETLGRGEISLESLTLRSANMPGGTSGLVVRRAVLEKVGLFDQSLPRSQDWDLMLRLAKETKASSIREVGVLLRRHTLPRPNASFDISHASARKVIHRNVDSRTHRARALAWTDYDYARSYLWAGRWVRSLTLFCRSYGRWPGRIPGRSAADYVKRMLEKALPPQAYRSLSRLYKKRMRGTSEVESPLSR